MFSYDTTTHDIHISRGDTATIDFQFEGDVPAVGDTLVLTLKRTLQDKIPKWEKEGRMYGVDLARFSFTAEDTKDLPFGRYYWDLRLFYSDGQITTVIPPAIFYIDEVVGNDRE